MAEENNKSSTTKIIEIEKLINKPVILFTSNNFRHEGTITDTGSMFITFQQTDEKRQDKGKPILLNINTIDKIIP